MAPCKNKGSVLITIIVAMTMMAIFGAGTYSLFTSSSFSELLANNNDNAYDLARAGIRYGVGLHAPNYPETTFAMPDADHRFTISIREGLIIATGLVNPGSFLETRRVLTYDARWAALPSSIISFADDMASFGSPIINNPDAPEGERAIQADQDGRTVNMGGDVQDAYGTLLYQGSSIVGYCQDGACSFGIGINVYFDFTFLKEDYSQDSTDSADGFTFAVLSAINNTRDRTGGAPAGYSQGELVGYAGPGLTDNRRGLIPPKMALEFDTYPNGNNDICSSGSRNDANAGSTSFRDHVALIFWGDRAPSGSDCTYEGIPYHRESFDDNRHGSGGSGGDPRNSVRPSSPNPSSGYYEGAKHTCKSSSNLCNWLEDGYTYSARIEITRPTEPSGGLYDYNIKAWILRLDLSGFDDLTKSHFRDVMVPFTDSSAQINSTISLSQANHDAFRKIYFGFTEATGAATQQITLSGLRAFFPQETCTYNISPQPANASFSAAGGAGQVAVATTISCPWMAWSTADWLTIPQGGNGKGNGIVNYVVAANTGAQRTAYINIAGQTFTIDQQSGCTYTLNPTGATPGSGGGSYTMNVIAAAGCSWTAVSDNAWITITSGSTGSGNGTVGYAVSANTGPQRTGTMTIMGQIFTVIQASGCSYSISPTSQSYGAGGGTGSIGVTASGSACTWTASEGLSWVAITSGNSGTGNGTVAYSVIANTGSQRNGTMTVAGWTFTVSQAQPRDSYSVRNRTGGSFRVRGGTYTFCQQINNNTNFNVHDDDPSPVNIYTNSSCTSAASLTSISYTDAENADGDGDGSVQINRSWQLIDR